MKCIPLIALLITGSASAEITGARSIFSLRSEPREGLSSETELGVQLQSGNTRTSRISARERISHRWTEETVQFQGKFLEAEADGEETADSWGLSLRYERRVAPRWGAFIGQGLESDRFAGYRQRYFTDIGMRRTLWIRERSSGASELGYRYQVENRVAEPRIHLHIVRALLETTWQWNRHVSSYTAVEFLPSIERNADWMLNGELSLVSVITETVSMKGTFGLRFDNRPAQPGLRKTDTDLGISFVARL